MAPEGVIGLIMLFLRPYRGHNGRYSVDFYIGFTADTAAL